MQDFNQFNYKINDGKNVKFACFLDKTKAISFCLPGLWLCCKAITSSIQWCPETSLTCVMFQTPISSKYYKLFKCTIKKNPKIGITNLFQGAN